MKLEIKDITKPTFDSVSICFAKPEGFAYRPGQHGVFNFRFDDKSFVRTYSFNSEPLVDPDLSITIRAVVNGEFSNLVLNNTPQSVELERVSGEFYIQTSVEAKRHLVMFAAGSGITPILSMIRSVLHNEPQSSISLVYSNQSFARIIFRHELDSLVLKFGDRLKIFHVLTKNASAPDDYPIFYRDKLSKLLLKKLIKGIVTEHTGCIECYMCGPFSFMQLVEESLQRLNIDKIKVFREHFYIPSTEGDIDFGNLPTREVIIQLKDEEKLLVVDGGKSILQAALANNIRLAHSCTEGQCGVCRSYLLNGEVKLRKNYILTDEELKSGQILLCQGFPVSEHVAVRPVN